MADVFISYSRLDHERVKPIADRLTSLGYTIWWDKHLRTGQAFVDEIEGELDGAKVVLTVWSANARNSTWVHAEANRGFDAGKLLQVRLDNVQTPSPFDAMAVADMTGAGQWGPLEDSLAKLVRDGKAPEPARKIAPLGPLATAAAAGMPKLITVAMATTLAAYAGAVTATYNGVMAPEQLQVALFGMLGVAGASALLSAQRLITVTRAGG